ncbi:ATP phosphoribosyltransferase regulatory subunit [Micractinium conductrix]|uniref:ATP phosphoribosyltransferase regulatory subunit n=1 Tax=Micractinium conductrix TaxID=554055 RepID=A0A2P6V3E5_9CHLO|nr:ATP phosphoribosyltransferase regulatory subunit [Micractinium conductrix]|eukprot:PSC68610.1 ATP phosphoribosyltransferase regulatory subunit [Micractinium conductrix]
MNKIKTALDTRAAVAAHSRDHDDFSYHVRDAPVAGTVTELTECELNAQFAGDCPPSHDKLAAALDTKDRLAAHGVQLPEAEALWREELEEGVAEVDG